MRIKYHQKAAQAVVQPIYTFNERGHEQKLCYIPPVVFRQFDITDFSVFLAFLLHEPLTFFCSLTFYSRSLPPTTLLPYSAWLNLICYFRRAHGCFLEAFPGPAACWSPLFPEVTMTTCVEVFSAIFNLHSLISW